MIKSKDQSWMSFALEMLILLLVILFIRTYVFQFFRVSGPSMCNTLNYLKETCEHHKGEFIFVNQFLYKFIKSPERGEIVIFKPPVNRTHYVKRVIGIPGDRVSIREGKLYLNNERYENYPLPEPYLSVRNQGRTHSQKSEFVVPDDHYLLMGDNRALSSDARQCFGSCQAKDATAFVHQKKINGRAEFVVWPVWTWRWLEHTKLESDNN